MSLRRASKLWRVGMESLSFTVRQIHAVAQQETVSQKPVLSTFWRDSHLDHVEQFTGFLDLLAQWWPVRIIEVETGVPVTNVGVSFSWQAALLPSRPCQRNSPRRPSFPPGAAA